jgi:hypothetical protein
VTAACLGHDKEGENYDVRMDERVVIAGAFGMILGIGYCRNLLLDQGPGPLYPEEDKRP